LATSIIPHDEYAWRVIVVRQSVTIPSSPRPRPSISSLSIRPVCYEGEKVAIWLGRHLSHFEFLITATKAVSDSHRHCKNGDSIHEVVSRVIARNPGECMMLIENSFSLCKNTETFKIFQT
jgi:hypothetical protein